LKLPVIIIHNNFTVLNKMAAVYRYHASQSDGWRFTFSTNPNLGDGWILDGIAFYAADETDPSAIPINQFHYDQSKTFGGWRFLFGTTMHPTNEGWTFDHVAFKGYLQQQPNTVPIYEFSCKQSDGMRFNLSTSDKALHPAWKKNGISFYAFKGTV
jgi:hypothetical protein